MLEDYCLFKVDAPGSVTLCIIGKRLVDDDDDDDEGENSNRHYFFKVPSAGRFTQGPLRLISSFPRYVIPIEDCGRVPAWPWEESKDDICLNSPIVSFSDTSCNMAACNTLPVLSIREDFQILSANQPYVCGIPSNLREWVGGNRPCDANGKILPWCL